MLKKISNMHPLLFKLRALQMKMNKYRLVIEVRTGMMLVFHNNPRKFHKFRMLNNEQGNKTCILIYLP